MSALRSVLCRKGQSGPRGSRPYRFETLQKEAELGLGQGILPEHCPEPLRCPWAVWIPEAGGGVGGARARGNGGGGGVQAGKWRGLSRASWAERGIRETDEVSSQPGLAYPLPRQMSTLCPKGAGPRKDRPVLQHQGGHGNGAPEAGVITEKRETAASPGRC